VVDARLVAALLQADNVRDGISEREREVLKGVLEGLSNKELAARFFRSESSIKNTLQVLFQRFGVHTRGQLVRAALDVFGSDV
jgi:DNA-binding NarL/FixJ family response regulator